MPKFKIVTNGDLSLGYRKDEVRKNLKDLCKYDAETLVKVLSGAPFTFKSDLDEKTAQRYKAAIDRCGIVCEIEADIAGIQIDLDSVDAFAISHHPTSTVAEKMTCPKCGKRQEKSHQCVACGVVVLKFQQQLKTKQFSSPSEPEVAVEEEVKVPGSKLRVFGWLLLVTFLAGAGFWIYRVFLS